MSDFIEWFSPGGKDDESKLKGEETASEVTDDKTKGWGTANWAAFIVLCCLCILLIIATIILITAILPEEIKCYSTSPANKDYPFVRSARTRNHSQEITYFCNELPYSPVFEIWHCNNNEWTLKIKEECECFQPPPAPIAPNVYDWDGSTTGLGTVVSYFCLQSLKDPFEVYECTNNRSWSSRQKYHSCENLTALCKDDPPDPVNGSIRDWNFGWYRVGTIIPYYCSNNPNSNVRLTYLCDIYLKWTKIFESHCGCDDDPPLPTKKIFREWDGSHNYGTVVTYFCEPDFNSSILLTYMCDGPEWKLVFRAACRIQKSCLRLPPLPRPQGIIRQIGTREQIGSALVYYCKDTANSKIYRTVVCNEFQTWEILLEDTCYNSCNKTDKFDEHSRALQHIGRRENSVGAGKVLSCTTHVPKFQLVPFHQSFVCTVNGTWENVMTKECAKALPYQECDETIPNGPPATILSWTLKKREVGSKLNYVCARHTLTAIAASFICSDIGKWKSVQKVISCICQDPPPLPASKLYRIVKPETNRVHCQYFVYCNNDPNSPLFMIITCLPQLTWQVDELAICTCGRPPPPEYPIVGAWNNRMPIFHLGTKITYKCHGGEKAHVATILECKSKSIHRGGKINLAEWEEIFCRECPRTPYICKNDPNSPPKFIDWDWDWNRNKSREVGTIITYYCRKDRSRVWMTSLCTLKGQWEESYTPTSCGCVLDPPLPPIGVTRSWDGKSKFGSTAYYMCVGTAQTRILRTLVCNAEGTWVEGFRGSCRPFDYACCIYKHPIIPKFREVDMWKTTNISGSTIKIFCPKKSNKINEEPLVEKIYVCQAVTLRWKLIAKTECPCNDPPIFPPSNLRTMDMMMRWNGHSTIGSIVKYVCHPSHFAGSPGLIMQCRHSVWSQIFQGACKCFERPKEPSPFSLRIWDKTSYIGSNITYRCSNDKGAPLEQVFTCHSNGQWIPLISRKHNCDCEQPPEAPTPIVWNWEGASTHMGLIVSYHCTHDTKSPQIVAIKCTAGLKWTVISIYNWTKDLIQFKKSVKYSQHHFASGIDPIPAKAGRLDLGIMTTVCHNLTLVGSEFIPNWPRMMTCRCECLDEPPTFPPPMFSNWNKSPSVTYYYGMTVTYWCSENSEEYITIMCREDRLWRPKQTSPQNTCRCNGNPPEEPTFKEYPIYRSWPGTSRNLGIKVEYRCSHTENAPVLVQYECVYRHETKRNEWLKNIDRAMSVCICTCALPTPPARTPPLQIVPQWTYGENKNELLLWTGSRYEYRCSNNVLTGIYQIIECGGDSCWKTIDFLGKCVECEGDPPTGPGIRNWDGSRLIGTIVVYQCSTDIHSMHAMDYECSMESPHKWIRIYNGSCDCKSFPETPPAPLKLQVDWLSPMSRHLGVKHAITCSKADDSPVVETMECDSEGNWNRESGMDWTSLVEDFCSCEPPPIITSYYEKKDLYVVGDEISFKCGFEADAAIRRLVMCSNQRLWEELTDNPHACMCLGNPPIIESEAFLDWNGSREINTEIYYRCSIHLPHVKQTIKCMSDGEWEVIQADESACKCVENKPQIPTDKDEIDMRWNLEIEKEGVLAAASLHCNNYNSSPIFAEITCDIRGEWTVSSPENLIGNILDDHFWNLTYTQSCFCMNDSTLPDFSNISVYQVEPSQRVIGSRMVYLCDAKNQEKFLQKFECTDDLTWKEVEIPNSQKCSCVEEPPPVPKYTEVIRDWNGSRFYGTEVVYYCKDKKTIFQRVQCGANGLWNYTVPPDPYASCECHDPPPAEPSRRREWKDAREAGSLATYMCSDNLNDTVLYNHAYRVYECSILREWVIKIDKECECPQELPESSIRYKNVISRTKHPLNRHVGGQVHGRCSDNKHSPEILIYTCHTNMTWVEVEGAEELINRTCQCPSTLPQPLNVEPSPSKNWTGDYDIGATIVFHCTTPDSPTYETYNCGPNGQWTKSHPADDKFLHDIHCHCSPPPPLPTNKPKVVRVEKDIKTSIGSKFSDKCSDKPGAPIYATYECTNKKVWKRTKVSTCACDTLPAGFPDTLYAKWTNPTPPGGSLTFQCTSAGGWIADYYCSEGLTWRFKKGVIENDWELPDYVETFCICDKPPPPLPGSYVFDFEGNKTVWHSGDKFPIRCSTDSKQIVSHYVCMTSSEWAQDPPLTDDLCSCKMASVPKPSEPYYMEPLDSGSTETVVAPKNIIYYCSETKPLAFKMIVQCTDANVWSTKLHEKPCKCTRDTVEELPEQFELEPGPSEFNIGTSINVQCKGFTKPLPASRYWCMQSGIWVRETDTPWKEISAEFCECPAPPNAPEGLVLTPENSTRLLKSEVNHQCTSNPSSGSAFTFTCTEKDDGSGAFWKNTANTSCECEGAPKGGTEFNDWDTQTHHVGTEVHFYCSESVDTPVKYSIICVRGEDPKKPPEWVRDPEENICECDGDPVIPDTPDFHIYYPEGRFVGARAKLSCSDDPNATAVALFLCQTDGEWIEDTRGERELDIDTCKCKPFKNPYPDRPVEYDPDDEDKKTMVGAVATVYCSEGHKPFIGKYKCNYNRKWEEIDKDKCECPPLPTLPLPQKIYVVNGTKNPRAIGQSHPITCNDLNKMEYHNHIICSPEKEWTYEKEHLCYCTTPPPNPTSPRIHLQWNQLQIVGTIANYTCTRLRTSPIVVSITCKFGDQWVKSTDDDENELADEICTCLVEPPIAEHHLMRVWTPENNHIGDVARYECSSGSVDHVYQCNMKRQWEKINMGFCECRSDLPALSPEKEIVTSKYQGAVAHFLCTADPRDGLSRDYRCTEDSRWELMREYSCQCDSPPPEPPAEVFYYDVSVIGMKEEYYVGSERKYFCSHLPNSKLIRTAKCVSPSPRADKAWEFDDKNISTWEILRDSCKCSAEPPKPHHNSGWDWDEKSRQEGHTINYYCLPGAPFGPIIATAVCNEREEWELDHKNEWQQLLDSKCVCLNPPDLDLDGVTTSWESIEPYRIGSIITYWCDEEQTDFHVRYQCNESKIWEIKEIGTCDEDFCAIYHNKATPMCLTMMYVPLVFVDQEMSCKLRESSVVQIHTDEDNEKILKCAYPAPSTCKDYFFNAHYRNATKSKRTVSPNAMASHWLRQHRADEDCAVIDSNGKWSPESCETLTCVICEAPAKDNLYYNCAKSSDPSDSD